MLVGNLDGSVVRYLLILADLISRVQFPPPPLPDARAKRFDCVCVSPLCLFCFKLHTQLLGLAFGTTNRLLLIA